MCSCSKTTYLFKCTLFVYVAFSSLQECTNNVHLRRWVVLEHYAIHYKKSESYKGPLRFYFQHPCSAITEKIKKIICLKIIIFFEKKISKNSQCDVALMWH